MGSEIHFIDTTCRDGHQSLWGTSMTTGMMLPIVEKLDEAGFKSVDINAPAHFKRFVRDLRDDPWERIRLVKKRMKRTPLSMMQGPTIVGFTFTPMSLFNLWMERLKVNGIDRITLMEPSNDFNMRIPEIIKFTKNLDIEIILALTYSVSPKHSDEYFAQKTRDAVRLGIDGIYLKDPGGLLTPERVRTLIPIILNNANGMKVEVHSHCTTGLAPLSYLEAIKLGIKIVHTVMHPLANSNSLPSVLNIMKNISYFGYSNSLNKNIIESIVKHFTCIAKKENLPIGSPSEYDYQQYIHQIPGGLFSNLERQLKQMGLMDKVDEVLEEIIQVRKELGYPIMVTPFSQFVVSQAVLNIITKERYKEIPDEIIQYALGFWGKEASSSICVDIIDKIMSNSRAKELSKWQPPEPSLKELRQKLGGPGISDEDLILRFMIGNQEEINVMRNQGSTNKFLCDNVSMFALIKEVIQRKNVNYFSILKDDFVLKFNK